jgi:hypothetical protein
MKLPKKLTQGPIGNLFYALLGVLVAVIFYYVILRSALATDLPMVAVVSNSMKHDASLNTDYYQWLENNLGYNKTYIDSWPVGGGFVIGDMPIIKGSSEYKVGDVIVYNTPCPSIYCQSAPIIHRIIKINEDGTYQTKGDNNSGQLPYETSVKKEQIHGKVILIIPKVGYLKVILNRMIGAIK